MAPDTRTALHLGQSIALGGVPPQLRRCLAGARGLPPGSRGRLARALRCRRPCVRHADWPPPPTRPRGSRRRRPPRPAEGREGGLAEDQLRSSALPPRRLGRPLSAGAVSSARADMDGWVRLQRGRVEAEMAVSLA